MLAIVDPRIGAHLRETLGAVRRIVGCAGRQGRPALSRAAKSFIDSRTSTVGDLAGQL